jgi:murein DD-endopeptidase MepM/ murein hydrolase activator NlpD
MHASAARRLPALALAILAASAAPAQTAVKYRDADGHWIFTDQSGNAARAAPGEPLAVGHESATLHINVERYEAPGFTRLVARNGCLCAVTVRATVAESGLPQVRSGSVWQATLEPGATGTLLEAPHEGSATPLRFHWSAVLGSPQAQHQPTQPYRAPFALGATFTVTQAYPTRVTHGSPDSRYAVDIAMPDGTPVYAAREGLVINLRHDAFLGAVDPVLFDQANVVEILHGDGTIACYAHLHWDSIRVHIGQRVARGEYIADSGNTGFTSGPHLHFAVWRNGGAGEISVPVEFAGLGGVGLTATTGEPLTAY